MKLLTAVIISCMLCGCMSDHSSDHFTKLREDILAAQECSFDAAITTHYSDAVYQFQLTCATDCDNTLSFSVVSPDTIRGIRGQISKDAAALSFDEQLLAFPIMADDRLTPVSAPWVFYNTLRNGYLTGCMKTADGFMLSIDDSFQENPLHLQIFTDTNCIPYYTEIYFQEQMVLSLEIKGFSLM